MWEKAIHTILRNLKEMNYIDRRIHEGKDIIPKYIDLLKKRNTMGVMPLKDLTKEEIKIGHDLKRRGILVIKEFDDQRCFTCSDVGSYLEQIGLLFPYE